MGNEDAGERWVCRDEYPGLTVLGTKSVFSLHNTELGNVSDAFGGGFVGYDCIGDKDTVVRATEAEAQQDVEQSVRQSVARIAEALGVGYSAGYTAGYERGKEAGYQL